MCKNAVCIQAAFFKNKIKKRCWHIVILMIRYTSCRVSETAAEKTAKTNQKNCWQDDKDVIIYYSCRKTVKEFERTWKTKLKKCWQTKLNVLNLRSCAWEMNNTKTKNIDNWTIKQSRKFLKRISKNEQAVNT